MKISFPSKPSQNALLIEPIFQKEKGSNARLARRLTELAKSKEFEAKEGQIFFLFPERVLLLGLGEAKKIQGGGTAGRLMASFGAASKAAAAHHSKTLALHWRAELNNGAQAVSEALVLGSYQPSAPYKTGKSLKKLQEQKMQNLEFVGVKDRGAQQSLKKGAALAALQNELRDWVNGPPNYSSAEFFDEKAREIAEETGAKLTIMKKKELEKLGMGAILGVNRGSHIEARLTILDYSPKEMLPFDKLRAGSAQHDKTAPIVFVGKGILFDSGGYNLKPRGYIEDMQLDKAGAAAVLMLIRAAHSLNIQHRIIAVAPFTENLIGGHALKPSEILKTYSGKTVEITNTDAEGRLVLADAIAYAVKEFKPKFLIDIATLTGAIMVALGDRYAGLFGNDRELMKNLRAAGRETDELLWPMPLHKDHGEKMKGVYADLRNSDLGSERDAGASKAAAFLKEFIGKTKWAHLDVAATAWTGDPKKYETKGATGFGLRLLTRFLENL